MLMLYKVWKDGTLATDLHIYVDDVRIMGGSAEDAWLAASHVAKTCMWLGMQDVARKH